MLGLSLNTGCPIPEHDIVALNSARACRCATPCGRNRRLGGRNRRRCNNAERCAGDVQMQSRKQHKPEALGLAPSKERMVSGA